MLRSTNLVFQETTHSIDQRGPIERNMLMLLVSTLEYLGGRGAIGLTLDSRFNNKVFSNDGKIFVVDEDNSVYRVYNKDLKYLVTWNGEDVIDYDLQGVEFYIEKSPLFIGQTCCREVLTPSYIDESCPIFDLENGQQLIGKVDVGRRWINKVKDKTIYYAWYNKGRVNMISHSDRRDILVTSYYDEGYTSQHTINIENWEMERCTIYDNIFYVCLKNRVRYIPSYIACVPVDKLLKEGTKISDFRWLITLNHCSSESVSANVFSFKPSFTFRHFSGFPMECTQYRLDFYMSQFASLVQNPLNMVLLQTRCPSIVSLLKE